MKKFIYSTLVILFLGSAMFSLNAQTVKKVTKKKPFITIDVNTAFNIPAMQLNGDYVYDIYKFYAYGTKWGIGAEAKVKMAVLTRPMTQLRTYLTFGYSQFMNSNDNARNVPVIKPGWPRTGYNGTGTFKPEPDVTYPGKSSVSIYIPYTNIGLEYAIYTDTKNLSSFNIGADIALSLITGRAYDTPANGIETYNTFHSAVRLGFGANLYYNYRLGKAVGINVGTRFHFANLLLKSANETTENGYIDLLDKGDGTVSPYLTKDRNIGFVSLYGGVSFYLGKR